MSERIDVGAAHIAVLRDGYWSAVPGTHLRDLANNEIPPQDFEPFLGGRDPLQTADSRVLTFLISSQGKNILVDSGVGGWDFWRFGNGQMLQAFDEIGLTPEQIDVVIPTHFHSDHIGGMTRPGPDGKPVLTYPNARYLFNEADWRHSTSETNLANERAANVAAKCLFPVRDAGQMELISGETGITDEVTVLPTPGHTPGSQSVVVRSGNEAAFLIGDLVHFSVQFSQFEWSPVGEFDRLRSPDSRRLVATEAARLNALVAGAHMEEGPTFGRMTNFDGRNRWLGV